MILNFFFFRHSLLWLRTPKSSLTKQSHITPAGLVFICLFIPGPLQFGFLGASSEWSWQSNSPSHSQDFWIRQRPLSQRNSLALQAGYSTKTNKDSLKKYETRKSSILKTCGLQLENGLYYLADFYHISVAPLPTFYCVIKDTVCIYRYFLQTLERISNAEELWTYRTLKIHQIHRHSHCRGRTQSVWGYTVCSDTWTLLSYTCYWTLKEKINKQ